MNVHIGQVFGISVTVLSGRHEVGSKGWEGRNRAHRLNEPLEEPSVFIEFALKKSHPIEACIRVL